MQALFTLDPLPTILIILVAIAAPLGAVRLAWGAWLAFYAHLVQRERDRIETQRQGLELALVRPDVISGLLPILRDQLDQVTAPILGLALARIQAQAAPANVPHSIHYAPHYAAGRVSEPAQIEAPAPVTIDAPTFAQLLGSNSFGRDRFLLALELASGQSIMGDWRHLCSTALGGLSGSGKSTTARFLLCQAALNGCKFVVLDPHSGDESLADSLAPLAGSMLCAPASLDRDIIQTARYIAEIAERRRQNPNDRTPPIMVCVDEATALFNRSSIGSELASIIEMIAQEGRKLKIYGLCCAQIWTADRSGGNSALRDSFASVYVHNMKRNQARLLISTEEARRAEDLEPGQALLWRSVGGTVAVSIPNTTVADVESVARICQNGQNHTAPKLLSPEESRAFNGFQNGDVESPAFKPAAAEDQRIVDLFAGGQSVRQIATELYGVSGGGDYNRALSQIQDVLRSQIRRG